MKDTNPIVYKFRDWNNPWHRVVITKKELFFSNFESFNDPFDTNKKSFPEIVAEMDKKIPARFRSKFEEILEVEKSQGILCLAKKANNPLMWGHYADSQKGFCVGFKEKELIESIKMTSKERHFQYKEVNYSTEIPKLIFGKIVDYMDYLSSRIYKKESIEEVIFGYKMDDAFKIEIRAICEKLLPHVKFFQAAPSTETFTMDINPVE